MGSSLVKGTALSLKRRNAQFQGRRRDRNEIRIRGQETEIKGHDRPATFGGGPVAIRKYVQTLDRIEVHIRYGRIRILKIDIRVLGGNKSTCACHDRRG